LKENSGFSLRREKLYINSDWEDTGFTIRQTEPKPNIYIISVYRQGISIYGALSPSTRPHLKTG